MERLHKEHGEDIERDEDGETQVIGGIGALDLTLLRSLSCILLCVEYYLPESRHSSEESGRRDDSGPLAMPLRPRGCHLSNIKIITQARVAFQSPLRQST